MQSQKKMKNDHPGERSPLIDYEDNYWTRQVFKTSVTTLTQTILLNLLQIVFFTKCALYVYCTVYLITNTYENWKFICALISYKYQTTTVIYKLYSSLKLPQRNTVFLSTSSLLQIPYFYGNCISQYKLSNS